MKMEHSLSHTDYLIWKVIQNGNGPVFVITDTNGMIKVLPPKTAEEVVARENERKARTTLLMALTEEHLAKFHKMVDAKEMWEAIKSKFGSNDESKKMHKYLLKQQFEGFSVSASEGDVAQCISVFTTMDVAPLLGPLVTSSIKNTKKGFKENEKEKKGKSLICDDQYESFLKHSNQKGFLAG
nr:xylulose kinase-1 [Tanacetum cinerariifolium]